MSRWGYRKKICISIEVYLFFSTMGSFKPFRILARYLAPKGIALLRLNQLPGFAFVRLELQRDMGNPVVVS